MTVCWHNYVKRKTDGSETDEGNGPTTPQSCRVHNYKQTRLRTIMKVIVKQWHAIAQWQWDTGKTDENGDPEEDVCGICRVPFEGCCPTCKVPGDDCPLSKVFLGVPSCSGA